MADQAISIGCVEDHAADVALLKHALSQTRIDIKTFLHAETLQGLGAMIDANVDVVLLDLGLPDSQGMDTVSKARQIAGSIPLIVLTGSNESGLQAIAAGADDFLDKDLIGGGQLARVVGYAVERHRLRVRLDQLESERELQEISARSRPSNAQLTSQLLGERPLKDVAPEVYKLGVEEFVSVVRLRLQTNAMGNAEPDDNRMRELGERIALRNAGPDDVVSILTEAVDRQRLHMGPSQFGPFVRESRVALIELMGFVLAFYRRHAPIGQVQRDIKVREGKPAGQRGRAGHPETRADQDRQAKHEAASADSLQMVDDEVTVAPATDRPNHVAAVPDIDDRTIVAETPVAEAAAGDDAR